MSTLSPTSTPTSYFKPNMPKVIIPVSLLAKNVYDLITEQHGARLSPVTVESALRTSLQGAAGIDIGAPIPVVDTTPPERSPDCTALNSQIGGSHYKDAKIQHVEFCQVNQLTWCESSAMKYLMRHRKKNKVQDVDKAIHYCLLLREIEYPDAPELDLPIGQKPSKSGESPTG